MITGAPVDDGQKKRRTSPAAAAAASRNSFSAWGWPWLPVLFLIAMHFDPAKAASDDFNFSACGVNEVPIRIELKTDSFPEETSWELIDISSSKITLVISSPPAVVVYPRHGNTKPMSYHTACIKRSSSCYQFVIHDSKGNGICCDFGKGQYKVFFDDMVVAEGGDFEMFEKSNPFGDGCPSAPPTPATPASPSPPPPTSSTVVKQLPTKPAATDTSFVSTRARTNKTTATISAADPACSSSLPVAKNKLTSSSFLTSHSSTTSRYMMFDSSKSISQDYDESSFIGVDDDNRRYFPKKNTRPEQQGYAYQPIPNCTSSAKRGAGCIAVPGNLLQSPAEWAGTIYFKPPHCTIYTNGTQGGICELGIPTSRTSPLLPHEIGMLENYVEPFKEDDVYSLPGGDNTQTQVIAMADVNNDGYVDIIVGNFGQSNQVVMNNGDGTFADAPIALPGGANN
jgi:hypothetical protein